MSADLLRLEGVCKRYPVQRGALRRTTGWVRAVDDLSLAVPGGSTLGLVGESGCGKTTLARMILKLLPCDSGRILFKGVDLVPLSAAGMRPLRREIQIVFQDPYGSLNPRMTVGQALSEGLRTCGVRDREEVRGRVAELLAMVGLSPEAAERFPHEFSGGQRQRVGIARALTVGPSLVVCDEPVSALDVSIQAQILNLLKDLQERLGLTYLFISHDLNVVGYLCDQRGRDVPGADRGVRRRPTSCSTARCTPTRTCSWHRRPTSKTPADRTPRRPSRPPRRRRRSGPCRFQPMCARADEGCRSFDGELVQVGAGHFVRCRRAGST